MGELILSGNLGEKGWGGEGACCGVVWTLIQSSKPKKYCHSYLEENRKLSLGVWIQCKPPCFTPSLCCRSSGLGRLMKPNFRRKTLTQKPLEH